MKAMPWNKESGRRKKRRILHNQELHKKSAIPERLRTVILIAAGLVILVLLVLLLRPQSQLLSSPEINMLRRRGVIRIGVTENVPGLGNEGAGLEIDLARALTSMIFSKEDAESALLLVPVTKNTAMPKLNDSDVDLLLCQRPVTTSESYACSAPYYQDPIRLLCLSEHSHMALSGAKIAVLQGSPVIAVLSARFS
ncbi:MAG: hypothetical protein PHO41_06520, partial [Eubacteriales bacterium]|nr:hypothetical protein [Eubacteriales bacterium]